MRRSPSRPTLRMSFGTSATARSSPAPHLIRSGACSERVLIEDNTNNTRCLAVRWQLGRFAGIIYGLCEAGARTWASWVTQPLGTRWSGLIWSAGRLERYWGGLAREASSGRQRVVLAVGDRHLPEQCDRSTSRQATELVPTWATACRTSLFMVPVFPSGRCPRGPISQGMGIT